MTPPTRKLAAILAADVAGYSKLMGEDETRTLAALRELRNDLFQPTVAEHRGEVVKSMGDGWLVEFASVVDAVNCAIQVQEKLEDHDIIKLRMGIHIGDIVHEDEDIYGDGVNIAARLQEIATPNAIVISDTVESNIAGRVDAKFDDGGERNLKNIERPVHTWWLGGNTSHSPASVAAVQPDHTKPSIVVLPFKNLSDDPAQDYLGDGLCEEIITALSGSPDLLVIARNSSFTFKNRAVLVEDVARELGVRHVLEGAVRLLGERVRVTAGLIDTATGEQVWSDRYDRTMSDFFELIDDISAKIFEEMHVQLTMGQGIRRWREEFTDPEVFRLMVNGRGHWGLLTAESWREASRCFEMAHQRMPDAAATNVMLGWVHYYAMFFDPEIEMRESLKTARHFGEKALAANEDFGNAHALIAVVEMYEGNHELALSLAERALKLDNVSPDTVGVVGLVFGASGKPKEAVKLLRRVRQMEPYPPFWILRELGRCLTVVEEYDEAIEINKLILETSEEQGGNFRNALLYLTIASVLKGDLTDAQKYGAEFRRHSPSASIKTIKAQLLSRYSDQDYVASVVDALKEGGIPEE